MTLKDIQHKAEDAWDWINATESHRLMTCSVLAFFIGAVIGRFA